MENDSHPETLEIFQHKVIHQNGPCLRTAIKYSVRNIIDRSGSNSHLFYVG